MGFLELFLLAIALSMDAFAVSICKGLSLPRLSIKHYIIVGGYFGFFQGLMPLIGYALGASFETYIQSFAPWIAFGLLSFIGLCMIIESQKRDMSEDTQVREDFDKSFSFKCMLPLALATSIDALAAGISLAVLHVQIIWAVIIIGVTTFLFSALGIKIGHAFGSKHKSIAELLGGIILIILGIKILFGY